jgi:catechol 2,3-dioxygenase-like lactoylglutathione lyase family enzyme
MPNIENLRKQAKLYLRWHRTGYHPVAVQIRSVLPRFGELSDRQVLESDFKLGDAQELVARKNGFESWAALIKGIDVMTSQIAARLDAATIIGAEPQIYVSEIKSSLSFYVKGLGFALVFSYGEPPFYAQVARGGARLNIRCVSGSVFDTQFRSREPDALSATVTLTDPKALFLDLQAAGISFHQTLRTEPWGARTFIVSDPDGNLIAFAGGTP